MKRILNQPKQKSKPPPVVETTKSPLVQWLKDVREGITGYQKNGPGGWGRGWYMTIEENLANVTS